MTQKNNGKPRRLRVLQVGKFYVPHVGGMETHLRTLCAELKSAVDLGVIVASDSSRTEHSLIEGVSITRVGTALNMYSTAICPRMARTIRDYRADLVHVHLPNPWAVVAYLLSGHRGPLVVTWHSDVVRQKALGAPFEVLVRHFLRRCNTIIATSDSYLNSSPVLSRFRDRCQTIPFGISTHESRCNDFNAVKQSRSRFRSPIVLSAGRLVYYKGLEYLIRAMNSVDASLVIVGDGPLRHRLETEAAANPLLRSRVNFLGQVEDVTPYYHACDVFALPSIARSEGFGIVQLEAMACAKPVVNTRLQSGVPFVSVDGVTGITVAPGNSSEMAAAINKLLDEDDLRRRYGEAALHRVRTEFTVGAMVDRTLDVYNRVVGIGPVTDRSHEALAEEANLAAAES
jgi:glycosyltransferase involved in cell wall biosynthesis